MSWLNIIILIVILAIIAFLVWASADIGSNVYLKSVCKANVSDKTVSLTFDDGPDAMMTPRVLDVLKKYNIKATFFVIGSNALKNYDIVRRMYEDGHIIGNHTLLHTASFPILGKKIIGEELQLCNHFIEKILGIRLRLFRPPFGVTNPPIAKAVKKNGFTSIGWSIRSLDTKKSRSREYICRRVVERLHDGAIILLHDRCADADVLLEMIIKEIYRKGYNIVPLDEMLNVEAYEN